MAEEVELRQQHYRGKTLEELQELSVREVAQFLPSRARRTVLRNFEKVEKFLQRCEKKWQRNKDVRTHLRDMVIMPKLVGKKIYVHNGKNFQEVNVTIEMIGHRLGEFAPTRGKVSHGKAGVGATRGTRAQKK
ncbi:30S ribosomal protein S19 [Candidatus Pacearchaeota archaeon]|nr:MAG: 30S ribosomal protein S19 [Candidatus Pacearchaeota archaeon]